MHLEIVILPEKTTEPLENWKYQPDANGKMWITDLLGRWTKKPPAEAWQDLALKIGALPSQKIEIFLCPENELAIQIYEPGPLEEVITFAQKYSWGAKIYVVCVEQILQSKHYPALRDWLKMLAQYGITAIIEIKKKEAEEKATPKKFINLRRQAIAVQDRRSILQTQAKGGNWVAVVDSVRPLVDEIASAGIIPREGPNQIIFYPKLKQRGMEKTRQAPQTGNRLLMAGRLSSEHQDILQELWNLKPVMFNGTLEWLYSFIQLNWQHRTQDSTHESTSENVNWIKLAERGHSKNHEYLNLLITAAFDAKSQADLCIAAAIQVGEVLRDLPFHINTTIFPYVTCDEIPAILGGNQFTVWLHISHGKRGSGLFEGRTENHAHLKRWEASIPARGGGLQLVILSACESDDIARALVMRGVRVAIGYEADVLSEAAKQLARRVIREALQWGDRQEAILRAFNEVCEDLHRFTAIRNGEIRRYVDSLPRAFVLDERAS